MLLHVVKELLLLTADRGCWGNWIQQAQAMRARTGPQMALASGDRFATVGVVHVWEVLMPTKEETYDEAVALQQQGRLEEAIGKLESLVEQEPDYALAYAALSVFYGKASRFDEAVAAARKVCELEPDDPFSFVAMSLICQKAGRLREAEEALFEARRAQVAAYMARQRQQDPEQSQ